MLLMILVTTGESWQSPGGPPPNMGFAMPMMKDWVPRWIPRWIQPWLYVLTALCFQFGGGYYLGALEVIRGTTNFMIEDVMFLLYASLAGMAVYFPMLFRMKFRFTNKQLLCDIPAIRTNIRKVPRWSVYAIEYLAGKK